MRSGHTARRRDAYRALTAVLTGLTAVGSVVATGYVVGVVTRHQDAEQRRRAEAAPQVGTPAPAAQRPRRRRPTGTAVRPSTAGCSGRPGRVPPASAPAGR